MMYSMTRVGRDVRSRIAVVRVLNGAMAVCQSLLLFVSCFRKISARDMDRIV
jgi:hypothetical protein